MIFRNDGNYGKKYLIDNKELMKEWDYEENDKLGIKPEEISVGSQKKLNWVCSKGHKYQRSVYDKLNGRSNCPYCRNRKILPGFNDLATTNLELLKEWNYEKNNELGIHPENITKSYGKKVWWKCDKGHIWEAVIYSRIAGSGCPYCSNSSVLKGYNDIATTNKELLELWNYEKNTSITPLEVSYGSTKSVWWKCKEGHEWKSKISDISNGNRCPYCSHKKVLKGYSDLATVLPDIIQYWDFEKNNIEPSEVTLKSNKKVWWICHKGHSYQMTIGAKTRGNYNSCPVCNKYKRISVPEKIIYYYLSKSIKNVEENYQPDWLKPKEVDIYISDLKLGIEYDGFRYHRNIQADLEKDILCENNGIKLIRIREKECLDYESTAKKIKLKETYTQQYKYLEYGLNELAKILNLNFSVNLEKDLEEVLKLIDIGNKNNCIAISNPEVLDEWDYDENEKIGISPYNVTKGTALKVNWICDKGHKYKASVSMRTSQHTGCPYCSKKKILKRFNDFATVYPEFLKEWNYEKNKMLPEETISGTNREIWWKCEKGHEYISNIANRLKGCGCPYCSGHQLLKGYNDIATTNPEFLEEWDYEKNSKIGLFPENIGKGYRKKAWWKCKKGHSYLSSVNNRITHHTDCPYCKGTQVLKGYNDIKTTNPELLQEWNYEENNKLGITPDSVSKGSDKKVSWICSKKHSYIASVANKINGRGCPYCSGAKVLQGFNDLATTHPELLEKWNYEKNNKEGIKPENISKSYSKIVWWKCDKGHEYQRHVYNQRNGSGKCPICKKTKE